VALDCVKRGIAYSGTFHPFPKQDIAIEEASIIRLEDFGKRWILDGTVVAPTNASTTMEDILSVAMNDLSLSTSELTWVPCLTIKGSCQIQNIELSLD
jgi:hypothetical protein